jgi:hypothetical protein
MGAPSPDLCNLWLARAFNAQDVDAAAAMYHPEASIVQIDDVHGGTSVARGASGIRKTMAAYVRLKPHMDVMTHHTTRLELSCPSTRSAPCRRARRQTIRRGTRSRRMV